MKDVRNLFLRHPSVFSPCAQVLPHGRSVAWDGVHVRASIPHNVLDMHSASDAQSGMTLKDYRAAHSLSSAEFGRLCGVSHTTVLRLERGELSPSRDLVGAIFRVTDGCVTANDLFQVAVS